MQKKGYLTRQQQQVLKAQFVINQSIMKISILNKNYHIHRLG